jgi:hypothetical protein
MGFHYPLNDAGDAECGFVGPAVRLPAQEHQPGGERPERKRIQAAHRSSNARQ